ncbi:fimbrial biogenesis chaperone [Vibrio fluminensis]|uniref:fimbrial biogenesis chaperone n=1 Tax=Vibrio fluminensis TaxID=2783614 RepID=UPI001886B2E0|nr:molecular chaperone [Vibrio fluminensis]
MKIFIFLAIFSLSSFSYAQLLISPTRIEIDGSRSQTTKVIVENIGDTPIRLDISPHYIETSRANMVRNNLNIAKIEDNSSKVRISPPVIRKLEPNQRRTIRVQVLAQTEDGEFRTYLKFSPTKLNNEKENVKNVSSQQSNLNINLTVHSYIPVYQAKGTVKDDVSYTCDNDAFSIQNHGVHQFNAWLDSPGTNSENLVLLRESTLINQRNKGQIFTVRKDGKTLYKCQ